MRDRNKSFSKLETDLQVLRSFVAVADEKGFSAAAKKVHRTQSAISLQIAKLEERLKVMLFERTSRVVSLTSAGEIFLSYAQRILELADEAMAAVSAPDEESCLRIGFADYLAPIHLQMLLFRFRRAHPHCQVNLVLGLGGPLLTALNKGELDLVFCGPESGGGRLLWEEPLVWTGHLPEALEQPLDLILMPAPCSYRAVAFECLTQSRRSWQLTVEANSVQAIQSTIEAGFGLSLLPASALWGRQMPVIEEGLSELPMTSVYSHIHPSQKSNPYIEPFIHFLLEGLGRQPIENGF